MPAPAAACWSSIAEPCRFRGSVHQRRACLAEAIAASRTCTGCDGKVIGHDYFMAFRRKKVLKVLISDDTGFFSLVCYNRNFITNVLKKDMNVYIKIIFNYKYGYYGG